MASNELDRRMSRIERVRAEYREMPGLRLTTEQACRLWQIDPATCESVLGRLVSEGVLVRTANSAYIAVPDASRGLKVGLIPPYRRRTVGRPAPDVPYDRFVVCAQNHDQVGNRRAGERLGHLVDVEGVKLAAAALLTAPFVPLLFMGEEYGERRPFQFFTDHPDPFIAEATREAGMRGVLGQTIIQFPVPDSKTPAEGLARTEAFIRRFKGDSLIVPAVALLVLLRAGGLSGDNVLSMQHALMLPSMIGAMLVRRHEYLA